MFAQVSERSMHYVRWLITIAWLILIISLFYDPITPWFSEPSNENSLLRINPKICVPVQGICLEEQAYPLGVPVFWGIIVPGALLILLIFGHETWRRICPLSFLSQISRRLGIQRQKKTSDKSGKARQEIVKINKNSWLEKNHRYLQFTFLFIGLCSRILFVNSDRMVLGLFLLLTIIAAITIGYLYGGKSWCQYFCPMAVVQKIYAEPRGLFNSTAHEDNHSNITQSMCRVVNQEGKEQSACIACQSPCMDIDAERSYWDSILKPETQFIYYAYFGLVVGYFAYYYLYAGNWDYYFSGAWAHQENQLGDLFKPGFYLLGRVIPIPKIVAVPLTLGLTTFLGYWLGKRLEKAYKAQQIRRQLPLPPEIVRHHLFSFGTFLVFNFFFIFGGRPFINLLPTFWHYFTSITIAVLSSFWLHRTWRRSPNQYQREGLAGRLRKQLNKMELDTVKYLDGRSLENLSADEVYVLAKILPDFTQQKRLQAYQGVLKEAIEEGYTDFNHSLEMLQQMRWELQITDSEHQVILRELGIEKPDILDPKKQYSHEDWLRLQSYHYALLESLLEAWKKHPHSTIGAQLLYLLTGNGSPEALKTILQELPTEEVRLVESIRQVYGVTSQEEEIILHRSMASSSLKTSIFSPQTRI
jgi:hypothetical protein